MECNYFQQLTFSFCSACVCVCLLELTCNGTVFVCLSVGLLCVYFHKCLFNTAVLSEMLSSLYNVFSSLVFIFTLVCARSVSQAFFFTSAHLRRSQNKSPLHCLSVSPSLDQHPVSPECSVQPPVPPLHSGHPVHRWEPGTLQSQTHSEPSPEATALPGSVDKQCKQKLSWHFLS